MLSQASPNESRPVEVATAPSYPSILLHPPLGTPSDIDAFNKAGRRVLVTLSPRGNSFAVYEATKDIQATPAVRSRLLYFAQWDKMRKEDAQLFIESYVTFDSLQRISFSESNRDGVLIQNPEVVSGCWRALGHYVDNIYAHLDRLGLSPNFNEARYNHYSGVASATHLLQVLFTSESGDTASSIVGEEFLYWLNTHYVAPTSEEGPELDAHEKPWLESRFWNFLVRCVLRGISKSAIYFLNKLIASHPSKSLRRLMTELVPILQKHPRSKDYDAELDFLTAHRRWKEVLVRNYRRQVDDLEDDDGTCNSEEGEWRSGVETICAILEGDRDAFLVLCNEQEWGWREALGVWGVWYDIKFTREALPSTLPTILGCLPIKTGNPDELVQSALAMYDTQAAIDGSRQWDLWFATHAVDVLDKLGELDDTDIRVATGLSARTHLLIEYAEYLYTDPSLWRVTLEYLGACGKEGRAMVAEVVMRVSVDIPNPPSTSASRDILEHDARKDPVTPAKGTNGVSDLDILLATGKPDGIGEAWQEWENKVLKIIDVCKDYGLEEVLYSVCRSISQALIRRKLYGRAVQYSVMARDGRGVGQIADLLLQVYITKGADEFRSQVAAIPRVFLPGSNRLRDGGERNLVRDTFTLRLQFIARYAELHEMFARGERKDAARFLVVMLSARIVPKWWWGVILLDAGGMLDDAETVLSQDDVYELLRHLEEIYSQAEQGGGAQYLGALDRIMQGNKPDLVDQPVDVESALGQLQVVRLAIARYLARCAVGSSKLF